MRTDNHTMNAIKLHLGLDVYKDSITTATINKRACLWDGRGMRGGALKGMGWERRGGSLWVG